MVNDQAFDRLAEEKQYAYHRRHFAATRNVIGAMDKARANIIRDLSKYTPPNVINPSTWLRLNANGDTLANLRKKAMQLPEPEKSQWLAKLNKPSWRAQITNKSALYSRLLMEGATTKATIDDSLREHLAGAAKEGFTRQMFEIQKGAGVGWAFDLPNTRQADALVRRVYKTQYTENLTQDQTDELMQKITAGIISGKSEKDIAKDIHEGDPEEIWKAKRLVRTELTAAAAEGELEAMKETGLEYYRFYATLDERTCPVCGEKDLQQYVISEAQEGVNKPPMHPNCRCVVQAVLEGDKIEDIVRRGRNEHGKGEVMPAGMTYDQWREKYVDEGRMKVDPVLKGMAIAKNDFSLAETNDDVIRIAKDNYGVDVVINKNVDVEEIKNRMVNVSMYLDRYPQLYKEPGGLSVVEFTDKHYDPRENKIVELRKGEYAHVQPTFIVDGKIVKSEEAIAAAERGEKVNFTQIMRFNTKDIEDPFLSKMEYTENITPYIDENTGQRTTWFIDGSTPVTDGFHEPGHLAHNQQWWQYVTENNVPPEDWGRVRNMMVEVQINEIAVEFGLKNEDELNQYIAANMSGYANTNRFETVAEAFRDVGMNGKKADPFSIAVVERFSKPFNGK